MSASGTPPINDALAPTRARMAAAWRDTADAPVSAAAAALRGALDRRRGEGAYLSAWRSYAAACASRDAAPVPVTASTLVVWAAGYVFGSANSSGSLATVLGRLQGYVTSQGIEHEGEAFAQASTFIAGLRSAAPSRPVRRAPELTYDGLARLFEHAQPLSTDDATALEVAAMAGMAWGSGMRACEYVGGRLTARDVHVYAPTQEHAGGLSVNVTLPKSNKRSLEPTTYVVLDTPAGRTPLVAVLSRWAAMRSLRLGNPADTAELFPRLRSGTTVSGFTPDAVVGSHTTTTWTALLRSHLTAAGVADGAQFTGHSLRAARRTQLARAGAPVSLVHAAVGWASTASEAYDRRRPDELLAALAATHRYPVTEPGRTRVPAGDT